MDDLNNKLEKAISAATHEIFGTMVMMDIDTISDCYGSTGVGARVSAMIGLGGTMRGLLSVHFQERLAIAITANFLGVEPQNIDEDVEDAAGEVANMIAGSVKDFFENNSIKTELAIPTTVTGKSYRTSGIPGGARARVLFSSKQGEMVVDLKYLLSQ